MIFLLGGRGYVGQAFQKQLSRRSIPHRVLLRESVDYSNLATLTAALERERPDFLINAAGYTGKPNVDACESDKANCLFGNAILPARIAEACEATATPWGHVSSGCIYSGARADGTGFTEQDPPNFTFRQNNCSFYSGSKAMGEEVLENASACYIWRLRIPFDSIDSPRNYLSKLMHYDRLLDAENSITHLDEFVTASLACWENNIPFGTYNVTNPGHVSTREVVELIRASGVCRRDFSFFTDEDEFMREAAGTPRSNCILSSEKLQRAGIELSPVREAIHRALQDWQPAAAAG